jgi:hypothetical protein
MSVRCYLSRHRDHGPKVAKRTSVAPSIRILTAVAPDTIERVRRVLAGHDLVIVTDLAGAERALIDHRLGLVFVGARFDDSRMFDLIELIRGEVDRKKKIAIVAAIITPTTLSKEAIAGLSHSVKIFGASLFVNLNDFPDDAVGNARVRLIVDTVILPPEVVQQIAPAPLRPT